MALEASILGKNSLYFGNPWFKGLPNTYSIKEEPSFELLASYVKYDSDHISNFLINIFKKHSFDSVIHLAGLKSINDSVKNPLDYYNNNVMGAITLL